MSLVNFEFAFNDLDLFQLECKVLFIQFFLFVKYIKVTTQNNHKQTCNHYYFSTWEKIDLKIQIYIDMYKDLT